MTQKAVFNLNLHFKKELTLILKPDLTKKNLNKNCAD